MMSQVSYGLIIAVLLSGFPMNVIALLPDLVEHYEEPNPSCTEAADRIAQVIISSHVSHIYQIYR